MPAIEFHSAKGGVGTTVTACALAIHLAHQGRHVIMVATSLDDVCAVLGAPAVIDSGPIPYLVITDHATGGTVHLSTPHDLPNLNLDRLNASWIISDNVALHPSLSPYPWVVCRNDYLSLRRLAASPTQFDGCVVQTIPTGALRLVDVSHVVRADHHIEVPVDPAVARAVDAGLLAGRLGQPLTAMAHAIILAVRDQ
jgi:hypothetical protein